MADDVKGDPMEKHSEQSGPSMLAIQKQLVELQKLMEQGFAEVQWKLTQPWGAMQSEPQDTTKRESFRPARRTFQSGYSVSSNPRANKSIRSTRGSRFSAASSQRLTIGSAASRASSHLSNISEALSAVGGNRSSLIWDATRSQRKAAERTASVISRERSKSKELEEDEQHWIRRWAGQVVDSRFVSQGVMLLVFVHVIMLGIEVDRSASSLERQDLPGWFSVLNLIIVCIFVLEMLMKMLHLGCSDFWCGLDSSWNNFDLFIVTVSMADVVLDFWSQHLSDSVVVDELRVWSTLRFIRAVRSIRILRIFRYVGSLRTLVVSITATMSSLFWTLTLLLVVIFGFAILLTQLVAEHCRFLHVESAGQQQCSAEVLEYWNSVGNSMFTLFMTVSQGIDWRTCIRPLQEVSHFAVGLMLLYVVITIFAVLNVVTGVFCNTAIESASYDKDVATMKQVSTKAQQAEQLKSIFSEMERKNITCITIDDLKTAMESAELQNFLESMGISTADVWTLFALLDTEEEGVMDLDAFVAGCMQMYGNAKSMQIAKLSYENVLLRRAVAEFRDETLQEISALHEVLVPRREKDSVFDVQIMQPVMEEPVFSTVKSVRLKEEL